MSQYDNTNTFIFSRNERKTQDTHPDWTGTINVNGVEFFLDGWIKTRKDGAGKFISGKIKRKDKQPEQMRPAETTEADFRNEVDRNFGATISDEIPF